MILWAEAIVSHEAVEYLWVNPACISLLKNRTRELVWNIVPNNPEEEKYNTIRWFSDAEKKAIQEKIKEWDMKAIQDFLNRYI